MQDFRDERVYSSAEMTVEIAVLLQRIAYLQDQIIINDPPANLFQDAVERTFELRKKTPLTYTINGSILEIPQRTEKPVTKAG